MKKTYEKPNATLVSFQLTEELALGGETIIESSGDLYGDGQSLDFSENGYEIVGH